MTKVKLVNGFTINAESVELINGVLRISTMDSLSVEELASLFSNSAITNCITLLTESGKETGYQTGFTSLAGIKYSEDSLKTIELFKPLSDTEVRIANVESETNKVASTINKLLGLEG